jgi:hypothetical protein
MKRKIFGWIIVLLLVANWLDIERVAVAKLKEELRLQVARGDWVMFNAKLALKLQNRKCWYLVDSHTVSSIADGKGEVVRIDDVLLVESDDVVNQEFLRNRVVVFTVGSEEACGKRIVGDLLTCHFPKD